MSILNELSAAVKRQRREIGLSQERLAQLAGLSRATINELETGKLGNLSLSRAERLANELGLGLGVTGGRRPKAGDSGSSLETAARAASVSYAEAIPVTTLRKSLLTGVVAPKFIAQTRAFFEEAPLNAISSVAAELAQESGTTPKAVWQTMRQLALALACRRSIWN